MSTRARKSLQLAVVMLGSFFFVTNVVDGVGMLDFLPVVAIACGLFAIERARQHQERGL